MPRTIIEQINSQFAAHLLSMASKPHHARKVAAETVYGFACYVVKMAEMILDSELQGVRHPQQIKDRIKILSRQSAIEDFKSLVKGYQ